MEGGALQSGYAWWLPLSFALLVGLATLIFWVALIPGRRSPPIETRLEDYLQGSVAVTESEPQRPFSRRVLWPGMRRFLNLLGRLTPKPGVAGTQIMLVQAGQPGELGALDFLGMRLLSGALFSLVTFFIVSTRQALPTAAIYTLLMGGLGYWVPMYWLRARVHERKTAIQRALPDALDMLTIGVEAGLGFESAMLRVGEQWENPLTREFRRAVGEMRVGTSREEALQRMATRSGVPDLSMFVAVLVQSSQLGIGITQVLHAQADQMRLKRRQRAEELAREAAIKMLFPLVFCVFPALFVVLLGPAIPAILGTLRVAGGGS
jgi:tight adherence protein C